VFILQRLFYMVGTEKKRSLSESRGDHLGGVFTNRGFTVSTNALYTLN
jgi:hypothetical protein